MDFRVDLPLRAAPFQLTCNNVGTFMGARTL